MQLRKINAGISLLTTLLVFAHAISIAIWMLSRGSVGRVPAPVSWVLTGLMIAHAFISIDLAISAHMNEEKHACKSYTKLNVPTMIQRMSGILMVIFTGLHIAGALGYMQPPKIVHGIIPPLFFCLVLAHVAVSTGKAFITLGIGTAKLVKTVDVVTRVLCAATLIADVVGFYLYVW